MSPEWSEWRSLSPSNLRETPNSPGIYEIRWAIKGEPQPINRAGAVDKSGLLYIGKLKNLRTRIWNFWRRIKIRKGRHTAGYTYLAYRFQRKFRLENLEFRWVTLSEDVCDAMEIAMLNEYMEKYLDRPPLNISARRGRR